MHSWSLSASLLVNDGKPGILAGAAAEDEQRRSQSHGMGRPGSQEHWHAWQRLEDGCRVQVVSNGMRKKRIVLNVHKGRALDWENCKNRMSMPCHCKAKACAPLVGQFDDLRLL